MKITVVFGISLWVYFLFLTGATAQGADVKDTYTKQCATCHGEQGKGDGSTLVKMKGKAQDWTDKTTMSKVTDEYLTKIIADGGAASGKSKLMPSYGKKLDEKAVKEMVSFIRSLAK